MKIEKAISNREMFRIAKYIRDLGLAYHAIMLNNDVRLYVVHDEVGITWVIGQDGMIYDDAGRIFKFITASDAMFILDNSYFKKKIDNFVKCIFGRKA